MNFTQRRMTSFLLLKRIWRLLKANGHGGATRANALTNYLATTKLFNEAFWGDDPGNDRFVTVKPGTETTVKLTSPKKACLVMQ